MWNNSNRLPSTGVVFGIDVGWTAKKPTTGLSLIEWDQHRIIHTSCLVSVDEIDRRSKIKQIVMERKLLAVGIDGPLAPGLMIINQYRTAEKLLSRGKFQLRGKPGPTNGGSGPRLHQEATALANLTLSVCEVSPALYPYAIHRKTVVEAFPNAFLGVLQAEKWFPSILEARRRWTDLLFPRTKQTIHRLLLSLLPKHELGFDIDGIIGHEQVASFICALTAFCVAANQCIAVGDANSGYIVLPPLRLWGDSINQESRWAEDELRKNAYRSPNAIIFSNNRIWTP